MSGKSRLQQIEEWVQLNAAADLSNTDNVTVVLYEYKPKTAKGIRGCLLQIIKFQFAQQNALCWWLYLIIFFSKATN